jgi:hypothetical protein
MVTVLAQTPISFDVPGRTLHAPLVEARIAGTATRLILDSGSTSHLFTLELVERCALSVQPGEPGLDHAGAPVPSWQVGNVVIEIERLRLGLSDVVAIGAPGRWDAWGIGGLLSPQSLHPTAFTVIDLSGNQLQLVDAGVAAMDEWLRARFPNLQLLRLGREPGEVVEVLAAILPFEPVVTMLNTGGRTTEFEAASVPGLRGSQPDESGQGVSGAEVSGEAVPGQTLVIAGARFTVPTLLVRPAMAHPPGIVGMDVLLGTVLVVSRVPERPIYWLVPTT